MGSTLPLSVPESQLSQINNERGQVGQREMQSKRTPEKAVKSCAQEGGTFNEKPDAEWSDRNNTLMAPPQELFL